MRHFVELNKNPNQHHALHWTHEEVTWALCVSLWMGTWRRLKMNSIVGLFASAQSRFYVCDNGREYWPWEFMNDLYELTNAYASSILVNLWGCCLVMARWRTFTGFMWHASWFKAAVEIKSAWSDLSESTATRCLYLVE